MYVSTQVSSHYYIGSLKLAVMEVFTPWKSANISAAIVHPAHTLTTPEVVAKYYQYPMAQEHFEGKFFYIYCRKSMF